MAQPTVSRLPPRATSSRDFSSGRNVAYHRLAQDDGSDCDTSATATANMKPSSSNTAAALLIRLGRSPHERIPISPADSARVLSLIDRTLLPLMLAVFFLQALDKATLSYAGVLGLIEDTGLEGDEFSWLGSIVYLAQLVTQLPLALALVKLPIGKFTGVMVLLWGITLAAMAGANNFSRLLVARFFLGAFESSVGPSFVAITGMWWRRREQTFRTSLWYAMNGLTWIVGSLMTYGLAHIQSSLKPYQMIFLFFGIVTIVLAFILFSMMPDSPIEARFLNDNDKLIAIERLRDNQMGIISREWRSAQFVEALCDPKMWFFTMMIFCISVPSSGISTFGPLVIETFVQDPFNVLLMNCPMGFVNFLAVVLSSLLATKTKVKGPVIVLLCVVPLIGCLVFMSFPHTSDHQGVLLVAFFLMSTYTGVTPLIYSWSAQNTAGDTKKKTIQAFIFIGASAGNVVGPLLFTPDEAPAYTRGIRWNMAFYATIICLVAITSAYLARLNAGHARRRVAMGKLAVVVDTSLMSAAEEEQMRREAAKKRDEEREGDADGSEDGQEDINTDIGGLDDITDFENENFVFVF